MAGKKLYRSKKNRVIAGVCGGLGDYFKQDPTLIRLLFVLAVILTGLMPGVLIYAICWIVLPEG